jgi:hypothetical protein
MNAADLVKLLEGFRFPTNTEAELGAAVRRLFDERGVTYQAEAWLGQLKVAGTPETRTMTGTVMGMPMPSFEIPDNNPPDSRIDFLVGRVGLELKTEGSVHEVMRQLRRYAESTRVDELVLLTSKVRLCGMPRTLGSKPVHVALCSRGIG